MKILLLATMLAPAVFSAPIDACQNLTTPGGTYLLNQSVSINGSTCFVISASNVVLDGQGFQVNGSIVVSGSANVTVRNMVVDPAVGLLVNNTNGSSFTNITLSNITQYGIWVANGSNRNNFSNISINASGGTGILVESGLNNSFDCLGGSITGNSTTGTYGVYSAQNNTTVKNCQISNFNRGISFEATTGGAVQSNTITDNLDKGIFLNGTSGGNILGNTLSGNKLYMLSSTGATVSGNNVTGISNQAFYILSSSGNLFANNTGNAGGQSGIVLDTSSNNNLTSNTFTASQNAIRLTTGSTGNNLTGNTANASGAGAISLFSGSSSNVFNNNNVTAATDGIYITSGSSSNNFTSNTANATTNYSIHLDNTGASNDNNFFLGNTLYSGSAGTAIYIQSGGSNSFRQNNISSGAWVSNSDATNTFNNSTAGNIYYFSNGSGAWSAFDIIDGNFDGYADSGASIPFNSTTVSGYWVGSGADYHPYTLSGQTCRNLTVANTLFTAERNGSVNGSTCISVQAQNITVDCAGYALTGNNTTGTYGVYTNQFNTTVKNCVISNFQHTIYYDTADNGTIQNDTANTTSSGGNGIYLYNGANYNAITNSTGTSDSNVGIRLSTSSNNTISSSTGTSNSSVGIYLDSSSNNNITNSNGTSDSNIGIFLDSSSNNTISSSTGTSTTNDGTGILLYSSSNNTLSSSTGTSLQNGYGIRLSTSSNNTLSSSTGTSNSSAGIYLDSSSNNNITNSNGTSNSNVGIYLDSSSNNTISNGQMRGKDNTYGALLLFGGSKNNTIANSTINGEAGTYALTLQTGANIGNQFINNTILNATNLLYLDTTSWANTFYWNNFTNTSGVYVNDTNGSNYYNATVNGTNEGNIYFNVMNGSVAVTGTVLSGYGQGLYLGSSGAGYPYNNSTSSGKFSCNFAGCADYVPLTPNQTSILTCSSLSTAGQTYNMTTNLSINGSTCFNVTAANVTLNCGGYTITGNNTTGTYGIYTTQFNTTLRNCDIRWFQHAIFWDTADNGTMDNDNTTITHASGYGIYLNSGASYNSISNSRGNSSNNNGIYLSSSSNNTITNSTGASDLGSAIAISSSSNNNITGSTGISSKEGIYLLSSSYNSITNSNGASLVSGYGIYITSSSDNNNLTGTTGSSNSSSAIYIDGGSNVSVDCQGRTMIGTNTVNSYGIYSNQFNTTIKNCVVANFWRPLALAGATSSSIQNSSGNTSHAGGSWGLGAAGIYLQGTGYTVNNSRGDSANATCGYCYGIWVDSSSTYIQFFNTVATSVNDMAFFVRSGSSYNNFMNITAYGSGSGAWNKRGFSLDTNANYNIVRNSNFSGVGGDGINFGGGSFNTVSNSTISSQEYYGVELYSGANNTIANSTISSAGRYPIILTGSKNNTLVNNTIVSTQANQTLVNFDSTSSGNTFYWNNFTSTTGLYVNDTNGTNFYNSILSGQNEGNVWFNVMNGSVQITGTASSLYGADLFVGTTGTGYPYNNSTSGGKFVCSFAGCGDKAPLTNQGPLQCSNLSTAGQTYNMTTNLSINGATCFNVTAQNVTLNCNGNTITGDNTSGTYGFYTNQLNTTIKNCTIQNFSEAIRYSGATDGLMLNNTLITTFNGGNSIRITNNAHRNNATQNVISNGNASGVYIDGGQNTTVDCLGANEVGGNYTSTYGIYTNQFNSTVKNCVIVDFPYGTYYNRTNIGLIQNNTFRMNGTAVALETTNGTQVIGNQMNTSLNGWGGSGVWLSDSNYSIIKHNNITSASHGILPSQNDLYGIYDNNTAFSTGASAGFLMMSGSYYNSVSNSTFLSSGSYAMWLWNDASYNNFTNIYTRTTANNMGGGVSTGSNYNIFDNFTANGQNGNSAFDFRQNVVGNIVKNSYFNESGTSAATAFRLGGDNNNQIINTTLRGGFACLDLQGSNSNNTFVNVTCISPYTYGFYQSGSAGYYVNPQFQGVPRPFRLNAGDNTFIDCQGGTIATTNATEAVYSVISNLTIKNCQIINGTYAVRLLGGINSLIVNSTLSTTYSSGNALLLQGASNNVFVNNTLIMSSNSLAILNASSGNNTFYWNNFTDTSGVYVNDTNGSNYYNSTSPGQNEGNIWFNVLNGSVSITGTTASLYGPGLYLGSAGTGYPYNNSTSQSKFSCSFAGCGDYAPLTVQNFLQCSNLSTASTTYNMTTNLSISGSTCFNVTAANVTLNCNGSTITGSNTTGTYGVYTSQFNTTLRNCIIQNFSTGVFYNGSSNGTIQNVSASTTHSSGYVAGGIVLRSSSYNTISNSTGTAISGHGLFVYLDSDGNMIANSTGISASVSGITLDQSYNNTIANSTGSSTSGWGILIDSNSNNTISDSSGISDSNYGIYLLDSSNITITRSNGTSNSSIGISLDTGSSNNTITNSYGSSITGYALYIESASGISVANSTFNSTSNSSAFLSSASSSTLSNCTFSTSDQYALYIYSGSGNSFSSNTLATGSAGTGIYLGAAANSSAFLANNITAGIWIENYNTGSAFNNSTSGNIYYFANGSGAWTAFDLRDTDWDNYADAGAARPLSSATASGFWVGNGSDYFPYMVPRVFGNGSSMAANISGSANATATIAGTAAINGRYFEGNQTVSISSGGKSALSFPYNFSLSILNFTTINITAGTDAGASYMEVHGANASGGLVGTKTFTLNDASSSFTSVCVKSEENASAASLSSSCTGANETAVACDGTPSGNLTCSRSGAALTITGLQYSAVKQFGAAPSPSPAPQGSNNGGGGGGSSSSSEKNATYINVDIGLNRTCQVRLTREITSSSNRSVAINTLTNLGASYCTMLDFAFTDSLPAQFPPNETEFVPQYARLNGSAVTFIFPTFSPNESRTIAYSVTHFVPPSIIALFKYASLSAMKEAAPMQKPKEPEKKNETAIPPTGPKPTNPQKPTPEKPQPETPKNQEEPPPFGISEADIAVAAAVFSLALAGLLFGYLALRKKGLPVQQQAIPAGGFGVSSTSLPAANEGRSYLAALSAAGGKPPYRWEAEEMPDWLQLDPATGRLFGVPPTGSAGTYNVKVYVQDSEGKKSILSLLYVEVNP